MLTSQKITRRQSEIREKLAVLAGIESPTNEQRSELDALDSEYQVNEKRFRAALISEDTERRAAAGALADPQKSEWGALVAGFELRQVALQLDEGRALDGKTAEAVQELRSRGGYRGTPVPYEVLEQRAGETIAEDVPNPTTLRPIVDRLFPGSVASLLGVQTINIPQGELGFPVATAGAVFGWQTDELSNVGAASAYETAERSLVPDHTGGAQIVITRKALKQSGAGLEAAIRRDLNAVIGAELDRIVVNGSGAAGQPLGMIPGAATYGITSTAVGAAATWAAFRNEVVAFMEANAITSASQMRLAFTPAIWAELDDALITGTAVSQLDRLTKHVGSPAISNVIPDETAIMAATVQGVAPGYLGLYGAIDLIRDPYTKAGSGQLVLTGLVTADFVVPRGLQVRILTGIAEAAA